jgi:hypothetical protein
VTDESGSVVHAFVNDLERPIGTHLYGRRMYETMVFWETVSTGTDQPVVIRDFAEIWRAVEKVVYSRTLQTVSSARTRIERDLDPMRSAGSSSPPQLTSRSEVRSSPARRSPGRDGPGLLGHASRYLASRDQAGPEGNSCLGCVPLAAEHAVSDQVKIRGPGNSCRHRQLDACRPPLQKERTRDERHYDQRGDEHDKGERHQWREDDERSERKPRDTEEKTGRQGSADQDAGAKLGDRLK